MTKIAIWVTIILAAGVVALASLGPGVYSSGRHQPESATGFLGAVAAVAATAPAPYRGNVVDQNSPSPTPTPTVTPGAAAVPQPSVITVQIGAYNDASVVSGGMWPPDQNLGGWTRLGVGPHQGGTFRSYVRFLVAGLPSGMQVDSALLLLTPMEGGTHPVPVEADYVQDDWNETTINWNQQPLTTYRAGVATWQPDNPAPVAIDVTPATQQWYACGGTSNNGLLLSADLGSDWIDFGSRKSATPPVLQVTYQRASSPVNCSAPPASNVSLTPPQGIAASTTGAQLGAVNPNDINNPNLIASGTPYGAVAIPIPPGRASSGGTLTTGTTPGITTGNGSLTSTGTNPSTGAATANTAGPVALSPAGGNVSSLATAVANATVGSGILNPASGTSSGTIPGTSTGP